MEKKLEIACFDLESALTAAREGAHRIEFCADYVSGGITPSFEDTKKLVQAVNIPVFVMIRPRGGNFVYTTEEKEMMRKQVKNLSLAGASGFVFGALKEDKTIDIVAMKDLLETAYPQPCTFHRAVDETPDLFAAVEDLAHLGFKRVLTSGGKGNAIDNLGTLTQLVKKGLSIGILPGGGVRSTNITALLETGAAEFHTSGITPISEGKADAEEIKKILHAIR